MKIRLGFWLNGIVLMPHIDLPTADLGETLKPVAEVSFAPLSMFVSFASFVSFRLFRLFPFVEYDKPK